MHEYLFPFISLAVGSSRTKRSTFQAPLIVHPDAVVSLEAHVRPGARAYLGDIAGAVTCWSTSFFVPPTANYASFTYPKLPGSSLSWDHEWVKDIGTCFQYIPRHALASPRKCMYSVSDNTPSFSFSSPIVWSLGSEIFFCLLSCLFVYFKERRGSILCWESSVIYVFVTVDAILEYSWCRVVRIRMWEMRRMVIII